MLNQGWIYGDRPKRCHVGLTVLDFYSQNYRHSSRTKWSERIAQGQIFVDGQPAKAEQLIEKNQRLAYHREPWEEPDAPLDYEIVHAEEDFLIIDKPSGLPVLPGGFFLENTLLHQLRKHFPNETPIPIHRLGRGTSGLMILGRSPLGKQHLSQQIRLHKITKIYRALIPAGDYPDQLTITTPIGKVPHPVIGKLHAVHPEGKPSHSEMTVLERHPETSLVAVNIKTGRPHQIRIHMAAIGFPLLGDPLYAPGGLPKIATPPEKTALPGDCGYFLHATELKFLHPKTLKTQSFYSPPQFNSQEIAEKFRKT
ncbi:RluA family pseudouridine synthase [[Limnothrix rosea] IAM M-220]|uniref:RluA family pseudouridine synthase n=1 Tax=[Limnothrix rosea] IAM M-220 TaxID=454133 RepID=UPI000969A882|nr:RluA family pseudouridine synthase [[Limnothrix rosea] IAM M-220]OKH17226.1 RNA pseudouridine synthase [[Limnothrix rosea] IAM M-220]